MRRRCDLCGTVHDSMRAAMDCCAERFADELATDGGERTIQACPECESAAVRPRNPGHPGSYGDHTARWYCEDCGARFDEPSEREAEAGGDGGRRSAPHAAALLDADAELVPDGGRDTDAVYLRVDGLAPADADGALRAAADDVFATLSEAHGDDVDGVVPVVNERYDPHLGAHTRALDVFEGGFEHLPDTVREQLADLGVEPDDLTPCEAGIRGGLWRSDVPALVATILERVPGQVEITVAPTADGHHWRVEWDCFDVDGDAESDEAADEAVTDGGHTVTPADRLAEAAKQVDIVSDDREWPDYLRADLDGTVATLRSLQERVREVE